MAEPNNIVRHGNGQSSPTEHSDEPATQTWDDDSALGDESDDEFDNTQSLSSSVQNYTYENGRRYHAFRAGQYFMPNDEHEQEGMDLMHHISSMILGGELYRAPIDTPMSILEIGTGTGLWAIDVADKFPGASVLATDLSPIQSSWVPPNLEFMIDDCESEWDFDQPFDFIHMRNLSGSIADWPKLLQNCYNHLKPGGWIEVSNIEAWGQSHNNSLSQASASYEWQNNLKQAAAVFGRELNVGPEVYKYLSQAGFAGVVDDQHIVPMSPWLSGKRKLARYFQALVSMELEALSLRLYTGVLGWPVENLHALLSEVRREIKDPKHEMFATMHYVYGRKPKH